MRPPRLPEHPRLAAAALARRGADPARDQAGDAETGVTIMQMDAGLDTGDDAAGRAHRHRRHRQHRRRCTTGWRRWARRLIVEALRRPPAAGLRPRAAAGRRRDLCRQDRQGRGADRLVAAGRRHRAPPARLRSLPGATSSLAGDAIKLWRAELPDGPAAGGVAAGTVLSVAPAGIDVATGDGVLRADRAAARRRQAPRGGRLPARGGDRTGQRFGRPDVLAVLGAAAPRVPRRRARQRADHTRHAAWA